jgi:Amidohydrolase family
MKNSNHNFAPTKILFATFFVSLLTAQLTFSNDKKHLNEVPPKISKTTYNLYAQDLKKAGEQTIEILEKPDGTQNIKVNYIYKNNGRGPEIIESMNLDSDGFPTFYQSAGQSTMGSKIDEVLKTEKNSYIWESTSEKGQASTDTKAHYVPLNGTHLFMQTSFNLLLKSKSKKIKLLPSGELTYKKYTEVTLKNKSQSQKVQLISFTGIGLSPTYIWFTVEKNPKLFSIIEAGFYWMTPQGWEDSIKLLEKNQEKIVNKQYRSWASELQKKISGKLLIQNAIVFDSLKAELTASQDILVENNKIIEMSPAGLKKYPKIKAINAKNYVVIPGLYDMHGHLGKFDGLLNLANGVTTVRDLGNNNEALLQIIEDVKNDKILGTYIEPSGFIEGKSPYSAQLGIIIENLAEAKAAVDWYKSKNYKFIKIYNSFPKEYLKETIQYAHDQGIHVSGHVPVFLKAEDVIDMGYDEIQHINQVLLNFLVKDDTDTRTLERFYLPAEKAGDLDFKSDKIQKFIKKLKDKNIVIDPTLAVFDFIKHQDKQIAAPYAKIADHMPLDIKRNFASGSMKIPNEVVANRYKKSYEKMIEFIGYIYKQGVPIVAGTDAFTGFALHSELELYVKAGLTPAQALQIATYNGAKYTQTLNERGSIEVGKKADLVFIDGNPIENIDATRKVALVMTQGKLIYPSDIYRKIGVKPFTDSRLEIR